MKKRIFAFLIVSLLMPKLGFSQTDEQLWVDSVFNSLTFEQHVGQLFNIRVNQPNQPPLPNIEDYIRQYNIGGITFFRCNADELVKNVNRWQNEAQTPMFVALDGEWGLGMRINNSVSYPYQMTLGALQDDSLIGQMGMQIAEQFRRMGIHINFAPCVDVNNNPANPVIGMRSFGENPHNVSVKASAYALAMQKGGLLTAAKHFPGHGNTDTDSHLSLPVVNSPLADVENMELYPFKSVIDKGINGVMVGHLYLPALEPKKNLSSSLSYNIITDLLIDKLDFDGLIYTDALDMKGAAQYSSQDSLALEALMAGADVLLMPVNVPASLKIIVDAAQNDKKVFNRVEESCYKILSYKYKAKLGNREPVSEDHVLKDIRKKEYYDLNQKIMNQAVTMVRNRNNVLPLSVADYQRVAVVTVGSDPSNVMVDKMEREGFYVKEFNVDKKIGKKEVKNILSDLKQFDVVILNVRQTNINAHKNYGITKETIEFVKMVQRKNKVLLNVFASPYALSLFDLTRNTKSILVAYEDRVEAEVAVTDIIVGQLNPSGQLPVSIGRLKSGTGLKFDSDLDEGDEPFIRVNYLKNKYIDEIDSIALDGILQGAYPGCQITAMHEGGIIYDKSFGYKTYDSVSKVCASDLYDVASLTKILASALAVMKLHEDSLLDINAKLSDFFPYLKNTDKEDITLIELFTHQSGLPGWIPIYKDVCDTLKFNGLLSDTIDEEHSRRVAEGLYINPDFDFFLFDTIAKAPLGEKKYQYCDIGFYFVPQIVKMLTNKSFETYLDENFYEPMHLNKTTFRPLKVFPKDMIVPTENDTVFRHQVLQGDVHDQTCALLGGVSGHAGLFSDSHDVALIMQMLVDGGEFDGIRLLNEETITKFTTTVYPENENRRAIIFDKPPLDVDEVYRTPSVSSSVSSFGHTGFTGSFAWADPENSLVVVFLSNRVFPDASNFKLSKLDIRTKIHDLFYEAVK